MICVDVKTIKAHVKVYEYLKEHNLVGVFKFNPYGTAYHGFLVPQQVNGMYFRLLLHVARMRINKVEISPTMTIQDARARERKGENKRDGHYLRIRGNLRI